MNRNPSYGVIPSNLFRPQPGPVVVTIVVVFVCVSLVFSEVVWLLQTIITMIASIDDTQYY